MHRFNNSSISWPILLLYNSIFPYIDREERETIRRSFSRRENFSLRKDLCVDFSAKKSRRLVYPLWFVYSLDSSLMYHYSPGDLRVNYIVFFMVGHVGHVSRLVKSMFETVTVSSRITYMTTLICTRISVPFSGIINYVYLVTSNSPQLCIMHIMFIASVAITMITPNPITKDWCTRIG